LISTIPALMPLGIIIGDVEENVEYPTEEIEISCVIVGGVSFL
jgi:hypothetical protein